MVYTTFRFSCHNFSVFLPFNTRLPPRRNTHFQEKAPALPGISGLSSWFRSRNESKTLVFYTFQLNHTQRMPTKRRALQRACYLFLSSLSVRVRFCMPSRVLHPLPPRPRQENREDPVSGTPSLDLFRLRAWLIGPVVQNCCPQTFLSPKMQTHS